MLLDSVQKLLGWHAPPADASLLAAEPAASLVPDPELAEDDDPVWPSARIGVAEALWGQGFLFPGGGAEVLRLATPLGLSAASSLLLIGAGSGGPPRCIAAEFGVWVTGYEANPRLVDLANERSERAGLGRRAQVEIWDTLAPKFPRRYFHHGMAIEPLHGAKPEQVLAAVALALKPERSSCCWRWSPIPPLDPADPMVATWARLDHRSADVPSELEITNVLGAPQVRCADRRGRVASSHAERDAGMAHRGARRWPGARPALRQIGMVVHEAELWLARFRLMRDGKLRLVRWHAIAGGG